MHTNEDYEIICKLITGMGFDAKVEYIELEEGVGTAIRVSGGIHTGANVLIANSKLRISWVEVIEDTTKTRRARHRVQFIDLYSPSSLISLRELLEGIIDGKQKDR